MINVLHCPLKKKKKKKNSEDLNQSSNMEPREWKLCDLIISKVMVKEGVDFPCDNTIIYQSTHTATGIISFHLHLQPANQWTGKGQE